MKVMIALKAKLPLEPTCSIRTPQMMAAEGLTIQKNNSANPAAESTHVSYKWMNLMGPLLAYVIRRNKIHPIKTYTQQNDQPDWLLFEINCCIIF